MAASPTASEVSHESADEAQPGQQKLNSTKDKECQYCHQKFTSSSLGRHLDQFISKKKPDGIHDVEGIKRLRAGITRRTARGKKGDQSDSVVDSHEAAPVSAQDSPAAASGRVLSPTRQNEPPSTSHGPLEPTSEPKDFRLNRAAWQSTGVITDPPATHVASPTTFPGENSIHSGAGALAGSKRTYSTYAADQPPSALSVPTTNVNETTRALELSLREVLDAVNAATRRAAPLPQPFPFELTSQTFPGLCLRLLNTPPTLFQSAPFSTPDTISLQPPGVESLHALRTQIRNILDQWKWDALAHMQKHGLPHGTTFADEATRVTQVTQKHLDEGLRHLDAAFQFFVSNGPDQQWQLWTLELLRVYKSEQDKVKESKEQMARLTQEAVQLQQQIDYLSKCQWPREMALWPPERGPFSSAVQQELAGDKPTSLDVVRSYGSPNGPESLVPEPDKWDFDKLVNKWKRHVREDRARRGISGPSAMLPPLTGDHLSHIINSPRATNFSRNSLSDSAGSGTQNGQTLPGISSRATNGGTYIPNMGMTDKTNGTFASYNASQQANANTPSSHSNQSSSRTQTPSQNNVTIVSDVDVTFGRFGWFESLEGKANKQQQQQQEQQRAHQKLKESQEKAGLVGD